MDVFRDSNNTHRKLNFILELTQNKTVQNGFYKIAALREDYFIFFFNYVKLLLACECLGTVLRNEYSSETVIFDIRAIVAN